MHINFLSRNEDLRSVFLGETRPKCQPDFDFILKITKEGRKVKHEGGERVKRSQIRQEGRGHPRLGSAKPLY